MPRITGRSAFGRFEHCFHGVRVELLPLLDHVDQGVRLGHRVLAEVAVHAVDDVVGAEVLAVVEGDALAQVKGELGGVRR